MDKKKVSKGEARPPARRKQQYIGRSIKRFVKIEKRKRKWFRNERPTEA